MGAALPDNDLNVYFGEIHTHTSCSFDAPLDKGPRWALEAARRNRLDFAAVTDHVQHVMPGYEEWVNAMRGTLRMPDIHENGVIPIDWRSTKQAVRELNDPGSFVTFLGYEWSSTVWGDHNVYYLHDDEPIRHANDLAELYAALQGVDAMVIPHHPGYQPGLRGMRWEPVDTSMAPLVEIFSQHGCSEEDEIGGRFHWNTGCMGPRCGGGTVRSALESGKVFGFIASSDYHLSYPGNYGTGLAAVQATALDRGTLWDAFWARRTYALTSDRIMLDFRIDGERMGGVISARNGRPREVTMFVDGWWCLDMVEIIKNGQVVRRFVDFDADGTTDRFKVNVDWGYSFRLDEVQDWNVTVTVAGGSIQGFQPRFVSRGLEQEVAYADDKSVDVRSQARGHEAQGISLDVRGDRKSLIEVQRDGRPYLRATIGELLHASKADQPFGHMEGSLYLSRAFPEQQFQTRIEWIDDSAGTSDGRERDYYYVRVRQKNDQMAWSSPIWVETA